MGACLACGETLERRGKTGPIPKWCSDSCRHRWRYRQPGIREARHAYNRAYYEANKERLLAAAADYYKTHSVEIRERCANYRAEYPEDPKAKAARNRDHYLRVKNERPTHYAEKRARRRALEEGRTVGRVDFDLVRERDGGHCYLCGEPVIEGDLQFDHVIPLSRGGAHSNENLRVTHERCNKSKGNRLPEEM